MAHRNWIPTYHSTARCQQRGISSDAVDAIINFGEWKYVNGGAKSYYMNKRTRKKAEASLGKAKYKKIESQLDCFAIVSGGQIAITVAHRLGRNRN